MKIIWFISMLIVLIGIVGMILLPYLFDYRSFWRKPKGHDLADAKKYHTRGSKEVDKEIEKELKRNQKEASKLNKLKNN